MRSCHNNGNGAACDICHTLLDPFEIFRFEGKVLKPGPRYPEITSDTKYKTISKFHMCETCYKKIIDHIKQLGLEGGE